MTGQEIDRARDALNHLDAGCDRATWHRYGTAAIAAGLSIEDLDEWSSRAANYKGARDVRSAFKTVTREGGIGPGSLFHFAREAGWSYRRTEAPPLANHNNTLTPPPGIKSSRAGTRGELGALEVWARCEPASETHAYIVSKQGLPKGLRMVPAGDPLRIAGQLVSGWLAVPVVPLNSSTGEPVSLQFIPPPGKGKKLNLPGAPMAGVFIVGDNAEDVKPGETVFIVEGIGQAWACWQAVGFRAVVAFGAGRIRSVAAELRQRYKAARLVVVSDRGKEGDAEAIAREVSGVFVSMPADAAINFDANDYAAMHGADALGELLMDNRLPPSRYKLLNAADLKALPPLIWRVRGVLPAVGTAAVFGPSTAGKSFLALDLAAHIAEGLKWFDFGIYAAPVVYVALEGEAGIRTRVEAWETAHGRSLPAGLRLVLQGFKLNGDAPDLAAAILAAVGAGAVVFLDTLNRAAPTADENSSRDMGEILEGVKELQRLTGGLVVLVHHTGKDAARGLRGHSSLFAALDAAIEVSRNGDRREWKVTKSKDGADGGAHPFRLEVVDLAPDDEGEPISSCVVRRDESASEVKRVRLPQGGNQRLVYDGIRDLFKDGVSGKPGAPPLRPCIPLEAAVSLGASRMTCPSDKRTSRARDAITGLVARGVFGLNDGWLWSA